MMLGKNRIAELRVIGKLHKLAAGSQTVPNFVAEIAAAQDKSPLVGPPTTAAPPAPQREKLPLKKAKRKAPGWYQTKKRMKAPKTGWSARGKGGLWSSLQPLRALP